MPLQTGKIEKKIKNIYFLQSSYKDLLYYNHFIFNFHSMELLTTPLAGIFGLIHLILFIWALLQILGSGMSPLNKIIWILIVGLFPVVGLIIWLLIGNSK